MTPFDFLQGYPSALAITASVTTKGKIFTKDKTEVAALGLPTEESVPRFISQAFSRVFGELTEIVRHGLGGQLDGTGKFLMTATLSIGVIELTSNGDTPDEFRLDSLATMLDNAAQATQRAYQVGIDLVKR